MAPTFLGEQGGSRFNGNCFDADTMDNVDSIPCECGEVVEWSKYEKHLSSCTANPANNTGTDGAVYLDSDGDEDIRQGLTGSLAQNSSATTSVGVQRRNPQLTNVPRHRMSQVLLSDDEEEVSVVRRRFPDNEKQPIRSDHSRSAKTHVQCDNAFLEILGDGEDEQAPVVALPSSKVVPLDGAY
jgi:hypothetical protein